jgi:energy-coupling factor transport system permease protein
MKQSFATPAWLVWLLSASILTLVTRNPLYLVIILASARIVQYACGRSESAVKLSFWRLAAVIFAFSILFNFLLVHVGQTVLFVLPRNWWLIGGPLTLEAIIYGAISALLLVTLLGVFLAFNSLVPTGDLISLTPRALSSVGIVVLIAVTYVPETLQQLDRVREAQALRGHRLRGLRDWQPIVVPLLVGGLERAMNLAETMVARGYGTTGDESLPARSRMLLIGALILLFGGWVISFWSQVPGWVTLLLGGLLLAAAFFDLGRRSRRTRYQPLQWHAVDWLVAGAAIVPLLLALIPLPAINHNTAVSNRHDQPALSHLLLP